MTKASADQKAAEMKSATKRIRAKGVEKPKHVPQARGDDTTTEVDTGTPPVVESKSGVAAFGGITSTLTTGNDMTKLTDEEKAAALAKSQEERAAKKKADDEKKAIEKQAKLDAAAAKKAEKAKQLEEAKAAKLAERERVKAEKAAAKAENGNGGEYTGSMTALADRVKAGIYVKGQNGQLHSGDAIATALSVVPAPKVVGLLIEVLGLPENPYASLNYGQQSMNLRNKLRGACRRDDKATEVPEGWVHTQVKLSDAVAKLVAAQVPTEQGQLEV